jgi:hypothetical protein
VDTNLRLASKLLIAMSVALGGCGRFQRSDPAQTNRTQAEVKRQQSACGSASASDELKNAIFDQAIAERRGDHANLDVLADYSVARLQDPVVKGWDSSLDITRCKARFILEVPPGAERAFAGDRQLQADIDYTAQASADGAGLVYEQQGAEPIITRLAAFNMSAATYRPPPAIDGPQSRARMVEQSTAKTPGTALERRSKPPSPTSPVVPTPTRESTPAKRPALVRAGKETLTKPVTQVPIARRSGNGEATIRAFYGALGVGNGEAASLHVIPEKRSSGAYSPEAMSRFYRRLPDPIRLIAVVPLGGGAYRVRYHYSAGRSRCNGSAVVRLANRGGRDLIRSIQALNGC